MAFAFPLLSIFHRHLEKQILCSYAKGHKVCGSVSFRDCLGVVSTLDCSDLAYPFS